MRLARTRSVRPPWARLGPALLGCLCLAAAALGSGCGLENFPDFLDPPNNPLAGGDYFQFEATSDNAEDDFRGFELYYKFYDPGEPSRIVDDQAGIAVIDNLGPLGYRRINRPSDRLGNIVKPLILVDPTDDKGKHFTVDISFQDLTLAPAYPRIDVIQDAADPLLHESQMESQDLRRGVTYTDPGQTTEFKRFNDFIEDVTVDADIAYDADIWTEMQASLPVTLVVYALSYGLFVPDNRELYSQPVKLGEISVVFPADQP